MKKLYLLFIILGIQYSNAQYTAIPDANFEQKLIDLAIDSDLTINGRVLTSDINVVTSLYIYSNNLHNLTGIEDFTSLQSLAINGCNNLTTLDLSGNPNLTYLECYNNNLTTLNISNNVLLGFINCRNNNLTTLDVSNNVNLSSIYCMNNYLTILDVSHNLNLVILYCYYNNITNLDVFNNTNLVEFHCDNNQITTLNISNNPLLKLLTCSNNLLTSLTITNVPQFVRLHCENNQLTVLNTNNIPTIKNLFCSNNLFTTIDLSNNLQLTSLYCSDNNNLINLNLNNDSLLNILYCNNNSILSNLSIQNGSNSLLNGTYSNSATPPTYYNRFDSTGNPSLHCIFVDDVANCNTNWLGKDATSNYVSTQQDCDNLQNEEFVANLFSIYPNAVNNVLFIENTNNNVIQKIVVYDLMGNTVIEQNADSTQLNFTNISGGLYLVKIITEKETIIKKIVKK